MKLVFGILAALSLAVGATAARADGLHLSAPPNENFSVAHPDIRLLAPLPPASPDPPTSSDPDFGNTRWQLGMGFAVQRVRTPVFTRTTFGIQTSLTYLVNDFFGVEGNIAGNCWCDGARHNGEKVEFVVFNAGPRFVWHRARRSYQPWVHALVGGIILYPQAIGSPKGFASQFGGGVDVRLSIKFSLRAQGDYIRSQLYSSAQNHFQFGAGIVAHF